MNNLPVLYAEDEPDDVFLMQRAFRDAGIENPLVVVNDGRAAVDYLSGQGKYSSREQFPLPAVVILDLKMPRLSGLEVLKWIRSQPTLVTLPVVMLTSSNNDADIHRAYLQGANGYLVKPGKPSELLSMVKALKDFWLLHNRNISEIAPSSPA
jgi:CheY-like chemotaxis protein